MKYWVVIFRVILECFCNSSLLLDTHVDGQYNTHLIGGQVHTQVGHLFSCAHPASFLPRHEVFICLRCARETQVSCTLGIQKPWLLFYCLVNTSHSIEWGKAEFIIPVLGQVGPGSCPWATECQQCLERQNKCTLSKTIKSTSVQYHSKYYCRD